MVRGACPPDHRQQRQTGEISSSAFEEITSSTHTAYVDVAIERWQADTGRDAVLDGDGRAFSAVKEERLGETAEDEEVAA